MVVAPLRLQKTMKTRKTRKVAEQLVRETMPEMMLMQKTMPNPA